MSMHLRGLIFRNFFTPTPHPCANLNEKNQSIARVKVGGYALIKPIT